jgi:plastocyanin
MRRITKGMLVFVLFPAIGLASEQCVTQLGGKCRAACAPGERSEQGAFVDCTEKERCCVPDQARGSASASAPVVVIDNMAFVPEVMKVKAGTEVVWRNDDGSAHTVTAEDGSFASPPLQQGGVFKKVFTKPGTYSYTCEMHPFMAGKIVVD